MLFLLLLAGSGVGPPPEPTPTIPMVTTGIISGVGSIVGLTDLAGFSRVTVTRRSVYGFVLLDSILIPPQGGFETCGARPASTFTPCQTRPATTLVSDDGTRP